MKFRIGPPPEDAALVEDGSGWRPVNEPSPLKMQILGVCMAVCIALCVSAIVLLFVGRAHVFDLSWPAVFVLVFLVLPVHELLHAVGCKGGVISRRIVLGFYPRTLGIYVHYGGRISRSRYIIIAALPFVVLSVVPLVLLVALRLDHEYLTELIMANGLASALDVLTIAIILKETPQRSVLINSGMRTYWRPE